MRNKIKEINPGVGVGEVKFGMLKEQVQAILGKPSETELEKDFDTADAVETWDYEPYGIAFSFDEEEDWKLETITINSSFYELNNVGFVGKSIEEVQNLIEVMQLGEMEFEDYSTPEMPNYEMIDVDASNLFFWFNNEVCVEVQMGVQWSDDDQPIWPKI